MREASLRTGVELRKAVGDVVSEVAEASTPAEETIGVDAEGME